MKVFFGFKKLPRYENTVLAIGVFDGVHAAHQRILKEAVRQSRIIRGKSIVLTFWPHPRKENSLYSLEHRLRLIGETGVDVCIVVRFNRFFAEIKPKDFVSEILINKISPRYIFVGKNFRFGRRAKGDVNTLLRMSKLYGFKLKIFQVIKTRNKPVSSTNIRRLIKKGQLNLAQDLLLRPVSVLGTIKKGMSLGLRLGFPTANIDPHHEIIPPCGIYAVEVILNKRKLRGVCYIGRRPTFKNKNNSAFANIEVHIFNFKKNIYGKYLEIRFIKKLRNDKKFKTPALLTKQIKKDIVRAKGLFFRHSG